MTALHDVVGAELSRPVAGEVRAFAADIAERLPGAVGVLFYGSCLREAQLTGLMLDFYLIVESYERAYAKRWLARANRILPPNVFYAARGGLTAKYAVLSLADFERECRGESRSVSVWARFAQPSRLVWARRADDAAAIGAAVAGAAPTLLGAARPLLPQTLSVRALWTGAFALTYAAELRAEQQSRGGALFDFAPAFYRALTAPALAAANVAAVVADDEVRFTRAADRRGGMRAWAWRRRRGKLISLARLAKATFTFDGGIDYLAWKINRHAGTAVEVKPWQRRHPIVAGLIMVPRLLWRGAIK